MAQGELGAVGGAGLGVDVGQVRFHGGHAHEQPFGHRTVGQALGHQRSHLLLGGRETGPADTWPTTLTPRTLHLGDRLRHRQGPSLGKGIRIKNTDLLYSVPVGLTDVIKYTD